MTGFDFASATFGIGFIYLILIALNFRKMRQISFTQSVVSHPEQRIGNLPIGVTLTIINTCDDPIIPIYISGYVLINAIKIPLATSSISLDKGSQRFMLFEYKDSLESLGIITNPQTDAEREQILQKGIKLSVTLSYYRVHLFGKEFIKREKTQNQVWNQRLGWTYPNRDQ
jgi:hypothetical protein